MSRFFLVALAGITALAGAEAFAVSELKAVQLRCEYETDPLGIDTAKPRLGWVLESSARGARQTAWRVLVAATPEELARDGGALWDSGWVESPEQNQIEYGGAPLKSHQQCHWKVKVRDGDGREGGWSAPACWTMGILRGEPWRASWVAAPEGVAAAAGQSGPLPLFRKSFTLEKPVRRAVLHLCGLGFHEAWVNGEKAGGGVYEPGWTNYRKTCLYTSHDVTALLREKENAVGVMLGNGMYNVAGGRYVKFKGTFGPPKLIAQLHIEYADGTSEEVGTDGSWRTARGPVVFSCIYGGEDYDARLEQPGWNGPGFDASGWGAAAVAEGPGGVLSGACAPPIRVMQTLSAKAPAAFPDGALVYDLGKNFSGRPRITVRGPAGATVKLVPGELLDEKGRVTQRQSGSPVSYSYTLKGGGDEVWSPRFSYYGFRYVQAEGAAPDGGGGADKPEIVELSGEFTHSSAAVAGNFECSNPLVNRVHELILTAIRSNLQSVLTDCPHREKLGWLEVSHLLSDGLMYNFDLPRFYAKVQRDMADAQRDNGLIPDIAPEYTVFKDGFVDSPEWGSAGVVNPWNCRIMYGDRRILEEHYGTMCRYADYLAGTAKDHIISHGLGDWYDVAPGGPGESKLTSKGVTATAVYYGNLRILEQAAALLGKDGDARDFAARAHAVRGAFNAAYYHPDNGSYDRNSQTANAMPLVLGLAEEGARGLITQNLTEVIRAAGYHVTAGDVGFSYLVRALTAAEQGDLLYRMVCQTDGPGYAMQLEKGATALTEAWDASPDSSNNHCMLGHVEGWFYRGLAGIQADPAAPGFSHFILSPQLPEGLDGVKAHYDSIRGRITSEWSAGAAAAGWSVTIPPNTTATVRIPAEKAEGVTENDLSLDKCAGISGVRSENGRVVFEAASGVYKFRWER